CAAGRRARIPRGRPVQPPARRRGPRGTARTAPALPSPAGPAGAAAPVQARGRARARAPRQNLRARTTWADCSRAAVVLCPHPLAVVAQHLVRAVAGLV